MSGDEPPPIRFKLSDGSSWPRPAMAMDEFNGVGWKCRYSPDTLTRPWWAPVKEANS